MSMVKIGGLNQTLVLCICMYFEWYDGANDLWRLHKLIYDEG